VSGGPYWVWLSQIVAGMKPGQRYRCAARLRTTAPGAQAARLQVAVESQVFVTEWETGDSPPLVLEFTAPARLAQVTLELGCPAAEPGSWVIESISLAPG
jgi:hypothetical protein